MKDCPKLPEDWKDRAFKTFFRGDSLGSKGQAVFDHERLKFPGIEIVRWEDDLGVVFAECRTTRVHAHTALDGRVRLSEILIFKASGFGTMTEVTEALVQYVLDCGCVEIET